MDWYWKLRRQAISTFTEGFYLVRWGRVTGVGVRGKILCMGDLRPNPRVYVNTYRDVVLERCDGTVAKKKSVGTLGENQTDRDVEGTICTRLIQIQIDSP